MSRTDEERPEDTCSVGRNTPRPKLLGVFRILQRDVLFTTVPFILIAGILYTLHHPEIRLQQLVRSGSTIRDEKVI